MTPCNFGKKKPIACRKVYFLDLVRLIWKIFQIVSDGLEKLGRISEQIKRRWIEILIY